MAPICRHLTEIEETLSINIAAQSLSRLCPSDIIYNGCYCFWLLFADKLYIFLNQIEIYREFHDYICIKCFRKLLLFRLRVNLKPNGKELYPKISPVTTPLSTDVCINSMQKVFIGNLQQNSRIYLKTLVMSTSLYLRVLKKNYSKFYMHRIDRYGQDLINSIWPNSKGKRLSLSEYLLHKYA